MNNTCNVITIKFNSIHILILFLFIRHSTSWVELQKHLQFCLPDTRCCSWAAKAATGNVSGVQKLDFSLSLFFFKDKSVTHKWFVGVWENESALILFYKTVQILPASAPFLLSSSSFLYFVISCLFQGESRPWSSPPAARFYCLSSRCLYNTSLVGSSLQ